MPSYVKEYSLLKLQSATYVWLEKKLKEEHKRDPKLPSLFIFSIHFNGLFALVKKKTLKLLQERQNE